MLKKIRNKIKTRVKILVDTAIEIKRIFETEDYVPTSIGETTLNGKTFSLVEYSLPFVTLGKRAGAMIAKVNDEYIIMVNKAYYDLPQEQKEFLLLHEIGHALHGDIENPLDAHLNNIMRTLGYDSAVEKEILADCFAAKHSSREAGYNLLHSYYGLETDEEIEKRINALRGEE